MHVVVLGGGIAGVAAAVAAAQQGARVTLFERSHCLGGVAVTGGHRTLCGLAAIDAEKPDLLEPTLTAAWLPRITTGDPQRHGRVWLWPTRPEVLAAGLQAGLATAGVEVRYGHTITLDASGNLCGSSEAFHPHALIDATGAAQGPGPRRPATQIGAWRLEIDAVIDNSPGGRRVALRTLAHLAPGVALTHLAGTRWQVSLDLRDPSTTDFHTLGTAVATALNGQLLTTHSLVAQRDDGGYEGLSLSALFSQSERGLAWAAWPSEMHTASGVQWTWPAQSRYGLPLALVKPMGAPPWLWCCGKGLAATPEAAGALRVTGTALALGSALGALVTTT